jgi:prefoldin subunit 5
MELQGLARAVDMLSKQVGVHSTTLDQLKHADNELADAIQQVSQLADDQGDGREGRYAVSPDEEGGER